MQTKHALSIGTCIVLTILSSIMLAYAMDDSTTEAGTTTLAVSWIVLVLATGYMIYKFVQCPENCPSWTERGKDAVLLGMGLVAFSTAVLVHAPPSTMLKNLSITSVVLSVLGLIGSTAFAVMAAQAATTKSTTSVQQNKTQKKPDIGVYTPNNPNSGGSAFEVYTDSDSDDLPFVSELDID